VRPYDTLAIEIEEGDLAWETLVRLDSAQAGQRLDPAAALRRAAEDARGRVEIEVVEETPVPVLADATD
jgi:hypothetical protein